MARFGSIEMREGADVVDERTGITRFSTLPFSLHSPLLLETLPQPSLPPHQRAASLLGPLPHSRPPLRHQHPSHPLAPSHPSSRRAFPLPLCRPPRRPNRQGRAKVQLPPHLLHVDHPSRVCTTNPPRRRSPPPPNRPSPSPHGVGHIPPPPHSRASPAHSVSATEKEKEGRRAR